MNSETKKCEVCLKKIEVYKEFIGTNLAGGRPYVFVSKEARRFCNKWFCNKCIKEMGIDTTFKEVEE